MVLPQFGDRTLFIEKIEGNGGIWGAFGLSQQVKDRKNRKETAQGVGNCTESV
jgi:hypothetical protein